MRKCHFCEVKMNGGSLEIVNKIYSKRYPVCGDCDQKFTDLINGK